MNEEEAEWVFRHTLQRHLHYSLTPGRCGTSSGWFSDEYSSYRTDGRLFAGAFPKLAERLALEVLNDPEGPGPSKHYAWFILSVLAPRSNPALESFLESQVGESLLEERYDFDNALMNLIRRRFDARTLALCREQARRGGLSAIYALSTLVDPKSIEMFQEMTRGDEDSGMPETAERMLERISILQGKDWQERLSKIIVSANLGEFYLSFDWALEAAENLAMPGLRAALEWRLLACRKGGKSPQMRFGYNDPHYQRLLVAWMNLGGALTADEERELEQYGFCGDFERRLQELLAARARYGY